MIWCSMPIAYVHDIWCSCQSSGNNQMNAERLRFWLIIARALLFIGGKLAQVHSA